MIKLTPGAALAATLLAFASVPASALAAVTAPVAVDRFIAARQQAPLWRADPAATHLLLQRLRTARLDGFSRGPALAAEVEEALARAQTGRRTAARQAERVLTNAWIVYAQALHRPSGAVEFADRSLAPAIPSAELILQQMATAPSLVEHVRQLSEVNPTYAALREAAVQAEADPVLAARLQANLDRARVLPGRGRFITVDLASQQLTMFEDGRPVDSMRVVVGKNDMPTPLLAGTVRQATFNPYWNVPVDLVATSIAPNVLNSGLKWLSARRFEVLSGWDADATPVDPATVDWQAVADGRTELRVRQRPGRANMMGAMKFEFPNRHGIYLHDTPERELFAKEVRTFSSGCVRLEDAARLGRWLLGREPVAATAQPEEQVALPQGVPVYLTYLTARVENGELAFVDDVYGLDGAAAKRRLAER